MLLVELLSPVSRKRRTWCLHPFAKHLKTWEHRLFLYSMLGMSKKNMYIGEPQSLIKRSVLTISMAINIMTVGSYQALHLSSLQAHHLEVFGLC